MIHGVSFSPLADIAGKMKTLMKPSDWLRRSLFARILLIDELCENHLLGKIRQFNYLNSVFIQKRSQIHTILNSIYLFASQITRQQKKIDFIRQFCQ